MDLTTRKKTTLLGLVKYIGVSIAKLIRYGGVVDNVIQLRKVAKSKNIKLLKINLNNKEIFKQ